MALSSSPSPVLNRKKLLPRNLTIIQKFLETSSLSVSYKVKDNLLGDSAFLKVYQRSDIMSCYTPKEMLDELQTLLSVNHQNLKGFSSCFEQSKSINLLRPFLSDSTTYHIFLPIGIPLDKFVLQKAPLKDSEIFKIFYQVVQAIIYLHKNDIFHGSLKPSNVLVNNNYEVTVVDFGWSQTIKHKFLHLECSKDTRFMVIQKS